MLTQTELQNRVADKSGLSRRDVKQVMQALEAVVLEEVSNAQKVKVGGIVQLDVRLRPATKARDGRNPATGEPMRIAAKPASVQVKARPLAKARQALPTVQKARRRLAAA
jgi:nucleoid DNA-binding protein